VRAWIPRWKNRPISLRGFRQTPLRAA
jgi:hypothetical protein